VTKAQKSPVFKHAKTREELLENFRRQVANFRRSCAAFDSGALEEAERLASSIYVLCHDGVNSNSKSLLGMLGFKTKLLFPDSASSRGPRAPDVVQAGPPLLAIKMDANPLFYGAPLGDGEKRMARIGFSKWWEAEVYRNVQDQKLSRKNLIFFLRSQDGGGHVDDNIRDESYYRFVKFGDHVSWNDNRTLRVDFAGGDTSEAAFYSVRQIAWEVDQAIIEDANASSALAF
jgi:hypothetical protein